VTSSGVREVVVVPLGEVGTLAGLRRHLGSASVAVVIGEKLLSAQATVGTGAELEAH